MAKQNIDLSDIGDAISDLATQIDARFNQVDQRFNQVDQHFEQVDAELIAIRTDQREIRELLGEIDSRILGIESDIKEIYDRIVALEKKGSTLTPREVKELIIKVDHMADWAKKVSQKTGIALPKL
jgi:septal ring factor EnvC (AmiA/AmiB activator)